MKNAFTPKLKYLLPLAFWAIISLPGAVFAQKATKGLAKFQFLIEIKNDDLRIVSKDGCAWKELSFMLHNDQTQAINQFGMTSVEDEDPNDSKLTHFLFTIHKTKEGLAFQGVKGTAWKNLSYDCANNNCSVRIDQNGLLDK